jgi:molybdenum-dependent DNA-binding transcriptional regulator ModE
MSAKERLRKSVFEEVKSGRRTLKEASVLLGLSYRQARRSYKRFRESGDRGLVHRSRGRASNRGKPTRVKKKVLARYADRYEGFGPTFAAEKLAKDGYAVDHETLRRWLIEDGQWQRRRKRYGHRSRRERKEHFGELVQMDGSHHHWFGPEHDRCCLMNMVDDSTGYTLSILAEEETTEAAMRLLWAWVERFGVPKALYTDKKSVFVARREPTLEEQLAEQEPQSAWGKACAKLGIELITAHSPQAKGRVERNHGVYQDRFVKELALRRITTIATANAVLTNGFTDELNAKFAHPYDSQDDLHRPVPKTVELADVFCYEEFRTVQNDWTIRHENRYYQILSDNRPLPKAKDKVVVHTRLDGSRDLLYGGKPLVYEPLSTVAVRDRAKQAISEPVPLRPNHSPKGKPKPGIDHPWRRRGALMAEPKG